MMDSIWRGDTHKNTTSHRRNDAYIGWHHIWQHIDDHRLHIPSYIGHSLPRILEGMVSLGTYYGACRTPSVVQGESSWQHIVQHIFYVHSRRWTLDSHSLVVQSFHYRVALPGAIYTCSGRRVYSLYITYLFSRSLTPILERRENHSYFNLFLYT